MTKKEYIDLKKENMFRSFHTGLWGYGTYMDCADLRTAIYATKEDCEKAIKKEANQLFKNGELTDEDGAYYIEPTKYEMIVYHKIDNIIAHQETVTGEIEDVYKRHAYKAYMTRQDKFMIKISRI